MKLKELESCLQRVDGFDEPKIHLEQYTTSPHIASHMLYTIDNSFNDISGSVVADFGCGCGVLTIGCGVMSAALVMGIDLDSDALEIATTNIEQFEVEQVELLQCDVNIGLKDAFRTDFALDTVVMNPPFGTKNNAGLDLVFVQRALDVCNGSVYSLHKSSTRSYVTRKCREWNAEAEVLAKLRFDLPKSYKFHKRQSVDVDVDFIRFTHA